MRHPEHESLPPLDQRNSTVAVIRYETAIKADKQLLIAHGTRIDVERVRDVLAGTGADSVEVHIGELQPA